jgi:hypothetical protein
MFMFIYLDVLYKNTVHIALKEFNLVFLKIHKAYLYFNTYVFV